MLVRDGVDETKSRDNMDFNMNGDLEITPNIRAGFGGGFAKTMNKVKKGDILVAVMTRPDYLPAMKRAAAIVTDEGGVTCHAAILSRELGIPCIIGTKIATKVLKDGQLVEVNANHSWVKIIK